MDKKILPPPQEIYKSVLLLVKETGGKFGRSTYCKILLDHGDKLSGELHDRFEWLTEIDFPPKLSLPLLISFYRRNYLSKDGLVNPTISITEEGKKFLKTGYAETRRKEFIFRKALYKALREERRLLAGELRIPVFNVCADDNLIRIANERPRSAKEIAKYFSSPHSSVIEERLLQVCLDFAPAEDMELSESERKIYELFLRNLPQWKLHRLSLLPYKT